MGQVEWGNRPLGKEKAMYCVDKVQYLPGLHKRYGARLDEATREAVRSRTERRLSEALKAAEVRD